MKVYMFRNVNSGGLVETTNFAFFDNENYTYYGSRDIKTKKTISGRGSRKDEILKLQRIISLERNRRMWDD